MKNSALFLCCCYCCCCLFAVLSDGADVPVKAPEVESGNVTVHNVHKTGNMTLNGWDMDSSMIQRALYVLIGITITGVLYFLIRAVRLKKSSTPRKKYGLLANYDDTVEMGQLESDDDDNTVYEAKSLRR